MHSVCILELYTKMENEKKIADFRLLLLPLCKETHLPWKFALVLRACKKNTHSFHTHNTNQVIRIVIK